jgi:AAA domain
MINEQTKQKIKEAMLQYIAEQNISERRFAEITKVNGSYINAIKQGNWNAFQTGGKSIAIKDSYFEKIASAIHFSYEVTYWKHFDTDNYLIVRRACAKAQKNRSRVGLDGFTGSGKTYALDNYKREHIAETFVIKCSGDMNPKDFMLAMAEAVGADMQGSRYNLRKNIVKKLLEMHRPVLIIDEAENVKKEAVLDAIKGMCDELEGKCGIVLCGVDIKEKFLKLSEKGKYCYPQINRRFNGSWFKMFPLTESDIRMVCTEVGIESNGAIQFILRNVKDYGHLSHVVSEALQESAESGTPVTAEMLRILNN